MRLTNKHEMDHQQHSGDLAMEMPKEVNKKLRLPANERAKQCLCSIHFNN